MDNGFNRKSVLSQGELGGGVDDFKEKILLNHLLSHSLFLIRTLPSPKNNKLLERKTNNDVVRITVYSPRESLLVRSSLLLFIELSRSTMAMNCKITVASEQLDHHSTEAGP